MQRRAFIAMIGGVILFLSCPLLASPPAGAEEIDAFYRASYAGLPAGEVRFRFAGNGATYRYEIAVESQGLPRLVTHFRGTAAGEGRFADDGQAAPLRYDALYDLRKRRDSRISMRFIGSSGDIIAEREAADTSRKPPLPELYRRNVVDPIAALAAIRHELWLQQPAPARDFTVPVYDGARRFDVLVHVVSAGGKEGVIRLLLTLQPIAGFRDESSEDGDPGDQPRALEAVFTGDANPVPLSMRVSVWYLPLVVQFDHFCKSFEACGDALP
jgi:hypothetical protein